MRVFGLTVDAKTRQKVADGLDLDQVFEVEPDLDKFTPLNIHEIMTDPNRKSIDIDQGYFVNHLNQLQTVLEECT